MRSKKTRSKRWDKGEERRAGTLATVAVASEQMALGGVVMATVPGHAPQRWADPNKPHVQYTHSQPGLGGLL